MGENARPAERWLLAMAAIVATSGLVFELLAATVASWVLGDTAAQFALVIGVYLGAMGLGSLLSSALERSLSARFVQVELAIALVGGSSVAGLFALVNHRGAFRSVLFSSVLLVGTLVGMEIPLLLRIVSEGQNFRGSIAKILAFDHLGSLVGSLGFAFLLVPSVGLLRTSLLIGLCNAVVALIACVVFYREIRRVNVHLTAATVVLVSLCVMYAFASVIERRLEALT
jgi:spermidine synthase